MTSTGGRRRAERPPFPWRRLWLHVAGAVASATAWFVLVRTAIDFGRQARGGETLAWLFLAVAAAGGVASLLLMLLLLNRALFLAGVLSDYKPKRARR
jgi:hypothetical protein